MVPEVTVNLAFGRTLAAWASDLNTGADLLGLAGHIAFALIPALCRTVPQV